MSVPENDPGSYYGRRNAYGKIIREKGTRKILIFAICLAVVWYVYSYIHTAQMNSIRWPALKPDKSGLTVLGLLDRNRPGWKRMYEAIESNHSWQIRRPDDAQMPADQESSADKERGSIPGSYQRVNRGEAVPVSELLKELPVVLNGNDFTGAWVEQKLEPLFDRQYYVVHVDLSDEGRSRYWQFSHVHEKERLVFILHGQILTCPQMTAMDSSSLSIEPIWVKADADSLSNYINCQTPKNCTGKN
jgi:hypothetical protein